MKFGNKKGISLEQNKEPMLSRDIKILDSCLEASKKINIGKTLNPELLAPHEIILAAKEAKIIDELDGKKTWKKLSYAARNTVNILAVDAVDDEPYISSQIGPSLKLSEELVKGILLAKRAIGVKKVYIEISKNLDKQAVDIPKMINGVPVELVSGTYPSEVEHRKHQKGSILVLGSCSLIALSEAVYDGEEHTSCFITVGGDCIANPANYRVPIGYPAAMLLEKAGLIADPKRIILGGSMTGTKVDSVDEILIHPATRGLLAFATEFKDLEQSCIGCGKCSASCPEGLSPYYIHQVLNSKRKRNLELFDVDLCVGCGICSYVCPAKIDLQQAVFKAIKLTRKKEK